MEWNWLLMTGLTVALTIAGMMIYMYKKGLLPEKTLTSMATLTDQLTEVLKDMGSSPIVATLSEYAAKAVRVVEQMVKNGQIEKDDGIRKTMALNIVEKLASADGDDLDMMADKDTIGYLIEAAVNEMQSYRLDEEALTLADGVDSDSLTDTQLRAVLHQLGATPEQLDCCKTRQELDSLLESYAVYAGNADVDGIANELGHDEVNSDM